ncbi:hypothetical protein PAXRUDRAFT_828071 [Paxillus rubicundulus Ve08.2h10]|uniref:Unplaced genomic scaffold scaffold_291, whole genome shotgun sequence n=1 Tax=Paxillus rubicundulus Ve08.2h10 TaxID=930991 RepID=A0A0D0E7U5_9AGAM|nr:hypothetical protein PAXRUDRAFT_828071 [Paxillus rubicundulus Ve08.2h10]
MCTRTFLNVYRRIRAFCAALPNSPWAQTPSGCRYDHHPSITIIVYATPVHDCDNSNQTTKPQLNEPCSGHTSPFLEGISVPSCLLCDMVPFMSGLIEP